MSNDLGPSSNPTEPNDPELIARVRAGDESARELLYTRHHAAAMGVARRHSNSSHEVEDLVSEGFEKVFAVLRTDRGPDAFFRAYLCTTVSRLAFAYNNQEKRHALTDDFTTFDTGDEHSDPVMNRFESGVVANAFRALPERWQAVLWYMEIDGLKPAEAAPLLGLSANGVSALAVRAREGLRQAYLQGHVKESAAAGGCQGISRQLGAYARGGLSARNEAKVDEHLGTCNKCTAILLQVNDVGASMRGIIAPLFLGGITMLGIPAAVAAVSAAGSGALAAGASAPGVATGATSAGTSAGGASGTTVLGGIGAFLGANALAVAVTGVAMAAVVAGVTLGIADLGRKDGANAGAGEIARAVPTGPGTGGPGERSAVPEARQAERPSNEPEEPVAIPDDSPAPGVLLRGALQTGSSAAALAPAENSPAPLETPETRNPARESPEPSASEVPSADPTPETPTSVAPESGTTESAPPTLPAVDITETPAETTPVVPSETTPVVPSETTPVVPSETTSACPERDHFGQAERT